jgi:hypothetical protein
MVKLTIDEQNTAITAWHGDDTNRECLAEVLLAAQRRKVREWLQEHNQEHYSMSEVNGYLFLKSDFDALLQELK